MTYHANGIGLDPGDVFNVPPPPSGTPLPPCAPAAVKAAAAVECERLRAAGLGVWAPVASQPLPMVSPTRTVTAGSVPSVTADVMLSASAYDWTQIKPCDLAKLPACESVMPTPVSPKDIPIVTTAPPSPTGPDTTTSPPTVVQPPTEDKPNYLLWGAIGLGVLAVGGAIYWVAR